MINKSGVIFSSAEGGVVRQVQFLGSLTRKGSAVCLRQAWTQLILPLLNQAISRSGPPLALHHVHRPRQAGIRAWSHGCWDGRSGATALADDAASPDVRLPPMGSFSFFLGGGVACAAVQQPRFDCCTNM